MSKALGCGCFGAHGGGSSEGETVRKSAEAVPSATVQHRATGGARAVNASAATEQAPTNHSQQQAQEAAQPTVPPPSASSQQAGRPVEQGRTSSEQAELRGPLETHSSNNRHLLNQLHDAKQGPAGASDDDPAPESSQSELLDAPSEQPEPAEKAQALANQGGKERLAGIVPPADAARQPENPQMQQEPKKFKGRKVSSALLAS